MPAHLKGGKISQYVEAVDLLGHGVGKRRAAMLTNLSENDVIWLAERTKVKPEEFQEQLRAEIELVQSKLLQRIESQVDKMSGSQAAVGYGILDDKKHNMAAIQAPHTQINVQINGEEKTKEQVIAGLFGNARKVKEEKR